MEADGVVGRYAIGGAVAAFNYIEVSFTEDLDILVSFEDQVQAKATGLATLGPILKYLAEKGFTEFRKEGVVVSGWPVQFLPSGITWRQSGNLSAIDLRSPTHASTGKNREAEPVYLPGHLGYPSAQGRGTTKHHGAFVRGKN
jgi:hypothetical protein